MAAFSAIKNKKNQKLREGIEDLALKCGDTNEEKSGVQLIDVQFLVKGILRFMPFYSGEPFIDLSWENGYKSWR